MNAKDVFSPNLQTILLEGLAYLLWLVNILVCVSAVIEIASMANALWVMFGGDRYSLSLVNQVCLLLGGLSAFIYVMVLNSYYREGTKQVRRPERNSPALRAPVLPPSRLGGWSFDPRVTNLLRRFAITTAIPLGMFILLWAAVQVALSYSS
jgi:hypothetical protein